MLRELGEDHSTLKDMALSVVGTMAAMGHSVAGDEILKNSRTSPSRISRSRPTIAHHHRRALRLSVGDRRLKGQSCRGSHGEWLDANLRGVTIKFASLREAGETAKI